MTDAAPDLYRYACTGFRPVWAPDSTEAARIFGNRLARRSYGRRGYCRTVRHDSSSMDSRTGVYEVFVGRDVDHGNGRCTEGHNEWLYLRAAD